MALEKPSAIYAANILIEDRIDADAYNYLYIKEISKLKFSGLKLANITDFYSVEMLTGFENSKYINYTNQGIPFIRCKNIRDNYFDEDDLTYISEEVYNILKRAQLSDDDLLYTKTGSNLGQVCCVPKGMKAIASSNCCFFKKSQNKSIDSHYVSTFLNSKYGKVQTNRAQTKTGQPTIDFQRLKQFLIPIPSPEIQKYIGDKVRKAEELREEAKRLKKEAEEIIYKKLGNIVLEDEKNYTANYIREEDIFERIDSEYYKEKYFRLQKQLKSKGFSLKTLDELCDSNIFNGRTYKTTNKKRKYMNIGVGELGDWFILANGDKYIDENINTNYLLDRYSIIWGNSAHLAKYIGEKVNINLETNSYVPTTEITCIKPNLDKINPYYLFLYMKSNWGYYQVQRTVKGMTAHSYPEDVSKIIVPILDFSFEELNVMKSAVELGYRYTKESKQLIQEAKQDVEDLIEGNFDMSKVKANS